MSKQDKLARRQALRNFLIAIPAALDRVSRAMAWAVVLAALALLVVLVLGLSRRADHGPPPPASDGRDNPAGALYVRDLGRLPDGRHTFDLDYQLVFRESGAHPVSFDFAIEQLAITDAAMVGDLIVMAPAPGVFSPPASGGGWRVLVSRRLDRMPDAVLPGRWRVFAAHYRINARPDQIAHVAIGYGLRHPPRGWFGRHEPDDRDAHGEDAQLGAAVRVHCALGVKITNGETRSLCAS